MVVSMVDVGEETGALPDMLNRIADNYDNEVDAAVEGLTSVIEPIMIIFLAVIVGTIVIAMFVPLISIIGRNQNERFSHYLRTVSHAAAFGTISHGKFL